MPDELAAIPMNNGLPSKAERPNDDVDKNKPLNQICAGDIDTCTGRRVIYVVYATKDFVVTIDEQLSLNWQTEVGFGKYAPDFGEVVGSCELSDALVDRIFIDQKTRMDYKKMLGAVIGRILDDGNSSSARMKLGIIDDRINEHGREKMRMNYIFASLITVAILLVLFLVILVYKKYILAWGFNPIICIIIRCSLFGGIAAFLTTFARFQNYKGSLVAGIGIHRLDGVLRIVYGLIAGLIIVLAVKSNIVVGFANPPETSTPYILYFLAMVAGASEVLIPNLIKQTEGELGIKKLEQKEKEQALQDSTVQS